jgi:lysophospholipase L1-like esterase
VSSQGRWGRYVAIGDSTTEGLDDPDERGGYRGWADRLAEHIATAQGGLEYANLAIRGRTTAQIRAEQAPTALALEPDLVSVITGMNDILGRDFDGAVVVADIEAMFSEFAAAGATVLTFTLPDPTPNLLFSRHAQLRLRWLNDEIRAVAARTGTILVDVATHPDQSDPRLWSEDRLHGNSRGHALVAHALAHGLGLDGFDDSWRAPLGPAPRRDLATTVRDDLAWAHAYALPWLWRTVRGRSAGDGMGPKRPIADPLDV